MGESTKIRVKNIVAFSKKFEQKLTLSLWAALTTVWGSTLYYARAYFLLIGLFLVRISKSIWSGDNHVKEVRVVVIARYKVGNWRLSKLLFFFRVLKLEIFNFVIFDWISLHMLSNKIF